MGVNCVRSRQEKSKEGGPVRIGDHVSGGFRGLGQKCMEGTCYKTALYVINIFLLNSLGNAMGEGSGREETRRESFPLYFFLSLIFNTVVFYMLM